MGKPIGCDPALLRSASESTCMDCFQRNIYQDSRCRYRKTVLQQPVFFSVFFDASPFYALGEAFPGRPEGAVFDGRPDLVRGEGEVVKNRGDNLHALFRRRAGDCDQCRGSISFSAFPNCPKNSFACSGVNVICSFTQPCSSVIR